MQEETFPITSYINEYLFWEIVVKQKEIRMYDLINGKLISIYSDIFGEENSSDDITKFKIDKKNAFSFNRDVLVKSMTLYKVFTLSHACMFATRM